MFEQHLFERLDALETFFGDSIEVQALGERACLAFGLVSASGCVSARFRLCINALKRGYPPALSWYYYFSCARLKGPGLGQTLELFVRGDGNEARHQRSQGPTFLLRSNSTAAFTTSERAIHWTTRESQRTTRNTTEHRRLRTSHHQPHHHTNKAVNTS